MFLDILDQALRQEERIFAGAFGRLGQVIERPTMVSIVSLVKESLVGIETRLRKLDEKADAAPFDLQRCIVPRDKYEDRLEIALRDGYEAGEQRDRI